ncbi:GNAT family N-acetyltransferase [uncultured Roseibium sp.]|uniref:GNAT family N-acetyltransferase n=1 Tax=uncultured Roseibium sp. TaxID=1936171 RepID=UPI003217C83B
MTLKLRPAHAGDTDILTDILHRSKASWGYAPERIEAFRNEYRITHATLASLDMVVAEKNGRPVAFAGGKMREDCLYLEFLFVVPEAMRQGIGSLLLQRMADRARTFGKNRILLESDYFARPFYENRGFTTLSERPGQMSPDGVIPMMEKPLHAEIFPLKSVKLTMDRNAPWAFERRHAGEIETHWTELCRKNPTLWNGRTLKLAGYTLTDGHFTGTCRECSYAAFLTWRDWGAPDLDTYNIFGSAVLRSSDGALLYGVMSENTANAGRIYPPGGNLDPSDIRADGNVDILGAIFRELEEETGLCVDDITTGPLYAIMDGPRISIARVLDVPLASEPLRERILTHSMESEEQELSDIRILRHPQDLVSPNFVPFARDIAKMLLPAAAPA